jgi:voltage-gated potassium channel
MAVLAESHRTSWRRRPLESRHGARRALSGRSCALPVKCDKLLEWPVAAVLPHMGDVYGNPRLWFRSALSISVAQWVRRTEWPLAGAAAAFLAAYAWPILSPSLPGEAIYACRTVVYATWAMFGLDYLVRLVLAKQRGRWFVRNLLDLLIVALPVLRPLRLLRLLALLKILNRQAASSLRGRVIVYVSTSAALIIFCAALAVLDAERKNPKANIATFGDALWWSATTVTTVGYGDRYPTTNQGRFVAVGLMLSGIALIGVVTASFASWLVDRVRAEEEESRTATQRDIAQLSAKIDRLQRDLRAGDETRTANGESPTSLTLDEPESCR